MAHFSPPDMLVLVLLLSFGVQNAVGIYGGCMSYSTTIESSGHLQVKIYFLNGWKIEKGPCSVCTAADKGSDVTQRRKLLIRQTNNQEMFGKWEAEVYSQNGTASYIDKTRTINDVSKDVVLIVDEKEEWELIGSEISLNFNFTPEEFDITLNSSLDVPMTLLPVIRHINLQVKVEPGIRNDTNKPNRSPVVLVKPFYSLEIGKIHTIHITSVDNDGDAIRCDKSEYVESSGLGNFVTNLTTQNIISLNRTTCVMKINVSQSYFHENDTFNVAVTVKDYGTHPLSIQNSRLVPHIPYKNVIGRVVALMYFKITGKTDPPEIIPPTPKNNQEYTIYVGGDFYVDIYAKAAYGRKIARFDFLRPLGKQVNHTDIQQASNVSENAVFISVRWSPTILDMGHHIICANAEDNEGIMTVDLHCFRLVVKVQIVRPTIANTRWPYFVSFPKATDTHCMIWTYCRFPVYVTTTSVGGIRSIVSSHLSQENITIQYSRELINGTIDAKVAQVEFLASQAGAREICLEASARHSVTHRCLQVNVDLPDPCASEPCQNMGSCQPVDDNSRYNCSCKEGFTGLQCEKGKDACEPNPCLSGGTCIRTVFNPHFICECDCGRTGNLCEIEGISSCVYESCCNGGFCDDHLGKKTCLCPMGFSGDTCSKEVGFPLKNYNNSLKYPLFGNILLPKQLICPLNEECQLHLLVSERNGFLIHTSMNSSDILVKEINKTRISQDYLVTLTLVPLKYGIHNLCVDVTTQGSSNATDRVCCSISTQNSDTDTDGACNDDTDDCRDPRALYNICSDPTTAIYCSKSCKLCGSISTNREKELFIGPSPQNSSIYTCSPGVECHMLLYLNHTHSESCPSVFVLPTAEITVHLFNNYDGDRCSVDILIKPSSSHPGQVVNLCVKASQHDSKLSEIRCYALEYVEHRSVQKSVDFPETTTSMTQRTKITDLGNVFG